MIDRARIHGLFPPDRCYLIGVSGGRDSVALLHLLVALGYRELIVCHLNHRLRGRAGAADARLVEKLAAQLGLKLVSGSASVRAQATKNKMSIETAAREARYAFFAATAKRRGAHTIFLGHHADDLVETFLLNLFRGSGLTGLAGMRQTSTRAVGTIQLTIVRPLLGVWRADIDKYVKNHRLKFREDATNKTTGPLRNRLRHRVVPYLEKTLGRKVRQNIWRTAMIAAEEESFFETLLPKGVPNLAVASLRDMSTALQRRTLHHWLRHAEVPDVGFDLIERIRQLVDSTSRVAKTNLPRDRHVRRRGGKLFME
jgi:tRNA(Ile)-lysidine synthase